MKTKNGLRRFLSKLSVLALACVSVISSVEAENESYLSVEVNSGRVLYSSNANEKRPIASLSHVATAVVALDWISRSRVELSRVITVPAQAMNIRGVNPMKLRPGDRLTFRDALYSTLFGADNISAYSLAYFVGSDLCNRRGESDPVGAFVDEMNLLAHELGMSDTKFRSPHGGDMGSVSQSTAADLALLGIYAMRNEAFAFIVAQSSRRIGVQTVASGNKFYEVKNTNSLLSVHGVDGIKTGSSLKAGPCAMIGAKRETIRRYDRVAGREALYPQRMVVVVLGSPDRDALCRELIKTGWQEFDRWLNAGMPFVDGEKRSLMLRGAQN